MNSSFDDDQKISPRGSRVSPRGSSPGLDLERNDKTNEKFNDFTSNTSSKMKGSRKSKKSSMRFDSDDDELPANMRGPFKGRPENFDRLDAK